MLNRRKVLTSSHHLLLRLGWDVCYNGRYKGKRSCKVERSLKSRSQFGIWGCNSPPWKSESLIIVDLRATPTAGISARAFYTPPVKPWELERAKSLALTCFGRRDRRPP